MAVGHFANHGSADITLAERWNGKRWAIQPTPSPKPYTLLSSVSCPSAKACVAVGSNNTYPGGPIAERWNGKQWAIQLTPRGRGSFVGASCISTRACKAVGTQYSPRWDLTLAERWNGTKWAIQPPAVTVVSSYLSGVSCTSGRTCTAAGYSGFVYESYSLAERWNGKNWAVQPVLNAVESTRFHLGDRLADVSCTSASLCTAVGKYGDESPEPLAEQWNGAYWAEQRPPTPEGFGDTYLAGVSCTSAKACIAVGFGVAPYHDGCDECVTMAEGWNGKSWTVLPTPAVAKDFASSYLEDVSCTSPNACIAAGFALGKTLSESWNGKSWAIQPSPNPEGAGDSYLEGISCASPKACTAVGYYHNTSGGTDSTLAERWNGTEWSIQPTPNPPGAQHSFLTKVSCASARACVAVGEYTNSSTGPRMTLAERWNGTKWSIQPTANPGGTRDSRLYDVSCLSATKCTAVGYYDQGSADVTLVERLS